MGHISRIIISLELSFIKISRYLLNYKMDSIKFQALKDLADITFKKIDITIR